MGTKRLILILSFVSFESFAHFLVVSRPLTAHRWRPVEGSRGRLARGKLTHSVVQNLAGLTNSGFTI